MIASVTPKVAGCSSVSGGGLHTTPTPLHTIGYAVATLASIHNIEASHPPRYHKKRGNRLVSSMVGHHIEISTRFLHDYVAVFQIAEQCKATPCHKPPLSKGGLEGL